MTSVEEIASRLVDEAKPPAIPKPRRCPISRPKPAPDLRINQQIQAREVRLIDTDGTQHGVPLARGVGHRRSQRSLDLVEMAATAVPPVCRIMDYGKFRYRKEKGGRNRRRSDVRHRQGSQDGLPDGRSRRRTSRWPTSASSSTRAAREGLGVLSRTCDHSSRDGREEMLDRSMKKIEGREQHGAQSSSRGPQHVDDAGRSRDDWPERAVADIEWRFLPAVTRRWKLQGARTCRR